MFIHVHVMAKIKKIKTEVGILIIFRTMTFLSEVVDYSHIAKIILKFYWSE